MRLPPVVPRRRRLRLRLLERDLLRDLLPLRRLFTRLRDRERPTLRRRRRLLDERDRDRLRSLGS